MRLRYLAATTLAATGVFFTQAVDSAHAAALGGSGTCEKATFTYLNCAGAFEGNDKGAQGTGLSNLNSLFGSGWSLAGDSEDGAISLLSSKDGSTKGSASTKLSGFGAIAVKAGNSYSLYTLEDLASFKWDTTGVTPVGKKGNTPGLSHLSVYTRIKAPKPERVPEPGMLLGLVTAAGAIASLKKKA